MTNYRYELDKSSRKYFCPNCKKKRFVVYMQAGTDNIVNAELYGKCDRISSCGYIRYPDTDDNWAPPERTIAPPKEPDFIPKEVVEKTFNEFKSNMFFRYLVKLFGQDTAYELQAKFLFGTAKGGGTIFWQFDKDGVARTGKVMYYGKNGKRLKNKNSWYLHNKVKDDYSLQQVFYNELSVNDGKPIAIVESEKTAVIMTGFYPETTWIATGGAEMINTYRLLRLPKLDKVFADNQMTEKWRKKTQVFNPEIDYSVDEAVNNGLIEEGSDILDLELLQRELQNVTI